jgi:hypothetical protein
MVVVDWQYRHETLSRGLCGEDKNSYRKRGCAVFFGQPHDAFVKLNELRQYHYGSHSFRQVWQRLDAQRPRIVSR